jgi:hypothetical protein
MKGFEGKTIVIALVLVLLGCLPPIVQAGNFVSGSTGADGDFTPISNTVLQIPESGVFNYGIVSIPSNVTVTFAKNSHNTPVTILATGDVLINGTISLNGGNAGILSVVGTGGPGGFDGGVGGSIYGSGYRGQGPGGGFGGTVSNTTNTGNAGAYGGGGGGFAGAGATGNSANGIGGNVGAGGVPYSNDGQLPMIGGAGGGGSGGNLVFPGNAAGGGGGAILIASSGTITVNGSIGAIGGTGGGFGPSGGGAGAGGGGGSGGGIRLVASTIAGNGAINAYGGSGGCYVQCGGNGGAGRVRLEAWNITRTTQSNPYYSVVWNPSAVTPPTLPSLVISSVGGVGVPTIPKGDTRTPDIQLPANTQNPVSIVVAAANIPVGTTVTVKASSTIGSTINSASSSLSGTDASSTTAVVSLNLPGGSFPSLITVSTTYTAVASNGAPIYAEGERVDKIRVDTTMGGNSTLTYITASGREIPVKHS